MGKHIEAIWASIKEVIFSSNELDLSFLPDSLAGLGFQKSEILSEAVTLIGTVMQQNDNLLLSKIIDDEDINLVFNTMTSYENYKNLSLQNKQRLHAVGLILVVSAKASTTSCNKIFECFFPRLMENLGLHVGKSSLNQFPNGNHVFAERLNYGALFLSIELLAACRDQLAGPNEFLAESVPANKTCSLVKNFSASLSEAFISTLANSTDNNVYDVNIYFGGEYFLLVDAVNVGWFSSMHLNYFSSFDKFHHLLAILHALYP